MECFAKPSTVFNAINGAKLIEGADIAKDFVRLSDAVQDERNFILRELKSIVTNQHGW